MFYRDINRLGATAYMLSYSHADDFYDYSTAVGVDPSFAYPFYIKVKLT